MSASASRLRASRLEVLLRAALLALVGFGLAPFGCSSARPASAEPSVAPQSLPPYAAGDAQLFDDGFSTEIFGAGIVDRTDPLPARARSSEGVTRGRIATVSHDGSGDTETYTLDFAPSGEPLKGLSLPGNVSLTVPAQNPSFGLVRNGDSGLVGVTVLLFYKRYNDQGRVLVHWHAEADNDRVRQAVANARLLGEVGR